MAVTTRVDVPGGVAVPEDELLPPQAASERSDTPIRTRLAAAENAKRIALVL